MSNSWLIVNGRILDPASGRDEQGDLLIIDGIFTPNYQIGRASCRERV